MRIIKLTDTEPRIPVSSEYTFRITADKKTIVIRRPDGKEEPRSVDRLRHCVSSNDPVYPEAVREMARQALEAFGLLPPEPEPEPIVSQTITEIQGIKVYQELEYPRRYFAFLYSEKIYRERISDLEECIKGCC